MVYLQPTADVASSLECNLKILKWWQGLLDHFNFPCKDWMVSLPYVIYKYWYPCYHFLIWPRICLLRIFKTQILFFRSMPRNTLICREPSKWITIYVPHLFGNMLRNIVLDLLNLICRSLCFVSKTLEYYLNWQSKTME